MSSLNDAQRIEREADTPERSKIESLTEGEAGWSVGLEDGTGFGLSKDDLAGDAPKVGDTVALYTHRGSYIHGIDLNGEPLFYKTEAEREAEHEERKQEHEAEMKAEFVENEDTLDRDFAALPEPFQQRIAMRRERNPEFRWRYEGYEMFCCKQAVAFAEHALVETDGDSGHAAEWLHGWALLNSDKQPPDGVGEDWSGWAPFNQRAKDFDYEAQAKLMPALDENHSGNTFGIALNLAAVYLMDPAKVPVMYGAMAPLVGSKEYGDPIDLMIDEGGADDQDEDAREKREHAAPGEGVEAERAG